MLVWLEYLSAIVHEGLRPHRTYNIAIIGNILTLGCRRYLRFVLVPVPDCSADASPCLPLPSVPESSLRYDPSILVVLLGGAGSGRSEDWPRDSAIARWSFYIFDVSVMQL